MSIFTENTPAVSVERRIADELVSQNAAFYKRLKRFIENQMCSLWGHEDPQAVLDEFGTETVDLFVYMSKLQQLVTDVDPEYEWLMPTKWGYQATPNPDGSVTATKIEAE